MELRYDQPERRLRIRTTFPMAREPRPFTPDELFRFGIEEEYFLSDSETFAAPTETPTRFFIQPIGARTAASDANSYRRRSK